MAFDVELKILANLDMDFQKHRNMIPKSRLQFWICSGSIHVIENQRGFQNQSL
jgi:hypothetical protein